MREADKNLELAIEEDLHKVSRLHGVLDHMEAKFEETNALYEQAMSQDDETNALYEQVMSRTVGPPLNIVKSCKEE